ncbi:MAG: AbrB/MazE/SpoVT family DNA-binding domain-containing protein [Nitrososphaerales archaeon]|nr:AbrB/MazE/SpoVT family DNA-binding domain-containing protein [Nitrososphaerales archaeon]
MAEEVVVTRRGQTTIPVSVRKRLGIREGTRLSVNTEDGKVVLSKVPSIFDLAGSSRLSKDQAFKLLDEMREED